MEGVNWIFLAQNRDKWRALTDTVNELSGSIRGGKFPDEMSDYQILKKDSASWTLDS
jgi:hypothetical protein